MKLAVSVLAAVMLFAPARARAQEVTEAFILNQLGPAMVQVQAEGLDGSLDSVPRIIEIFQAYGIDASYRTSVDEARWVAQFDREDRDFLRDGRMLAALKERSRFTPSQITVGLLRVQNRRISCREAQEKADAAQRLSDVLADLSRINAIAMGITAASGAGIVFTAPIGFGALTTSIASAYAARLASAYRAVAAEPGVKCTGLEGPWTAGRPATIRAALRITTPFRTRDSSRGGSGSWPASWRTSSTTDAATSRSRSVLRFGGWRRSSLR
jgi:hypothetical protein